MKKTDIIKAKWFSLGYKVNIETDNFLILVNDMTRSQCIFTNVRDGYEISKGIISRDVNDAIQDTLDYFELKRAESDR